MTIVEKIVAKNTLLKCNDSPNWKFKNENLCLLIGSFETLDAFLEYLVLSKNAPLNCLPYSYIDNKDFLFKLLNQKQSLINEIYSVNYYVYQEILTALDLRKFLKHCKFGLLPEIKRDINFLLGNQTKPDEITTLIPTPKDKTLVPTKK